MSQAGCGGDKTVDMTGLFYTRPPPLLQYGCACKDAPELWPSPFTKAVVTASNSRPKQINTAYNSDQGIFIFRGLKKLEEDS